MSRPRDSQRAKVTRAEDRALLPKGRSKKDPTYAIRLTSHAAEQFAAEVITSRWWRQHGSDLSPTYLEVVDWAICYCQVVTTGWKPGYSILSLSKKNQLYILHALAHELHDEHTAWHGPEFVRSYIRLVDRFLGSETGKRLREEFSREKVKTRATSDETKLARAVARTTKIVADLQKEKAYVGKDGSS